MWQNTKNVYHLAQGITAHVIHGFPSRGLKIIGVTGTDGKTTTASMIHHVLTEAGHKTALITSGGAIINGKKFDTGFHVTTPNSFAIQSFLKKAKKAGVTVAVLEVTSHALDQHRVFGIPFDLGVVTNITKEHLDYHKTYERYVAAKAKLLKKAKVAVVNKDDRSYKSIKGIKGIKSIMGEKKLLTYGFKKDADINPHLFPFRTKLIGKFNEYNALAAISVLREFGLAEEHIRKGLASFKSPIGRQEIVYRKEFTVINDFAHTPNSFAQVLPEIRKITPNRLIHVFGAAAKRDTYKRPEMGKVSSEYADIIVLTAEDPRDEPIEKIIDEIKSGIKTSHFEMVSYDRIKNHESRLNRDELRIKDKQKYVFEIPDRKEAIAFAISLAQKGDTVVLTGKGHEKSMNYGKGEEAWDETQIAKEAVRARK